MTRFAALLGLLIGAAPVAAADYPPLPAPSLAAVALPSMLSDTDRAAFRSVFASLHRRDWSVAASALDALPASPLASVARAQLALAKTAPPMSGDALAALATAAPDMPDAAALAALARVRGARAVPPLPLQHALLRAGGASKRQAARPTRSDALAARVQPLIKAGELASAEALLESAAATLEPEVLTEWRQRIAWGWFQAGDDSAARRVAERAAIGVGAWAVQATWVSGLAAWRAGDYAAATQAFERVARGADDGEASAAGYFWEARSLAAGGRPEAVSSRLQAASRTGETFYGLLAGSALGLPTPDMRADAASTRFALLLRHPNLRAALAAREIGETALADQLLRQQARIGAPSEHCDLIALAAALDLPETQVWLAQNVPAGVARTAASRFPMPAWAPSGGWRVDRALLLAHALQESQFRADAVSRAGARGLMQIMPATARLVARHRGDASDVAGRLNEPALSFEYGQSYLEELAAHWGTGGLLPKVIAAYNAGPNNVAAWSGTPALRQDPLLFIEAIPFAETRAYVAIVLRNYWMYQREMGADAPSLALLAQGRWPRFPASMPQTRSAAGVAEAAIANGGN